MKMSIKNIFKMLFKVLPYVYRGNRFNLIFMSIVSIIYSTLWFSIVPANNYMFDTVLKASQNNATFYQAIISIIIVLGVLLIQHVFNGLNAYNHMYQYFTVLGYLHQEVNKKVNKMPAIEFENKTVFEEIEKAKIGTENGMLLVNIFEGLIFFYTPQLLLYTIYFYKINKLLTAIVFLIFIPQIISSIYQSKHYINLENELSPMRRRLENYDNCITGHQFVKETKMLGAYSYFAKLYDDALIMHNNKKYKLEKKVAVIRFFLTLLTLCGYVGVLIILLVTMIQGNISIGSFSAILISLTSLIGIIKELTFDTFSSLSKNFGSVLNFVSFMERKEACCMENKTLDYSNGIIVNDVSFQYPNTNKKSIDNISIRIHKGETIAIVGENGAGKSTLARLLLGLYQPDEGEIIIGNAVNEKDSPYISHKNTSAIFQNFQRFALTVKENVNIGDLNNNEEIDDYLKTVGIDINSKLFSNGQATILSPEFGGIDLSGGLWQRLAIARGLYKKHDMIILDEPTAAIDPIEETKVFKLFADIAKDKIAVIITHRLGSVKFADRIIVLDAGKIVEEGTHEQLLNNNGKYAFMYKEQAKWYERN